MVRGEVRQDVQCPSVVGPRRGRVGGLVQVPQVAVANGQAKRVLRDMRVLADDALEQFRRLAVVPVGIGSVTGQVAEAGQPNVVLGQPELYLVIPVGHREQPPPLPQRLAIVLLRAGRVARLDP